MRTKFKPGRFVAYIFLVISSIVWLAPTMWTLLSSFRSNVELTISRSKMMPIEWVVENYVAVLSNSQNAPILTWFSNSMFISVSHTILVLFVSSMAAYAFTRLEFKGKHLIFWGLMATVMFPGIINFIPMFYIADLFGWVDHPLALIIPGIGGVFNVFLIRQFLLGIPRELDEAAYIDGASEWSIYTKIIIPLARPVLTIVALFSFTGSWNDFLFPSVVIHSIEKLPLTPALRLLQGTYSNYPGYLVTSVIVAMIPTIILFLMAQKHFIHGLVLSSGIKG